MTTIPGPTLAELTRRALVGARFMRRALRDVFLLLAGDVQPDTPKIDDLIKAHTYWSDQVDNMLLPNILDSFNLGIDIVRKYLDKEHTVPDVTNPYVELYLRTTRNRLTGISGMVWLAARDELVEGLRRGEDIDALRNRVTKATGIVGPRAETVARTEVNGAMNAGSLIQMQQIGIPFTKTWLATAGPRTRESHAKANGQTVEHTKKFTVGGWPMDRPHDPSAPPAETENCIIGSTEVDAPLIQMAMRRWFEGEVIILRTAASKTLTVTPNHPVLTDDGWVQAQHLEVGDHVVCGNIGRHISSQGNEQRRPTSVAEVYDSATCPGIPEYCERRVDFHGERATCEVHVVAEDRSLGLEVVPAFEQEVIEFGLTASNLASLSLSSRQPSLLPLRITGRFTKSSGVRIASCGVSRQGLSSTIIETHRRESNPIRGCNTALFDSVIKQYSDNSRSTDTQALRKSECGFTLQVALDDVISVECLPFSGHVYNLSTTGGWYTSNSIITRNCRCTLTYEIPTENALRRKKVKKQRRDAVDDLLDILTAGGGAFHNQPGDHPGGKSPISHDDFDTLARDTDDELTFEQRTLLGDYRNGWGSRDEVVSAVVGNRNYQDQLRSQLSRYAPDGEVAVYRGGAQTGKFANGSLDHDTAANFGSGFAGPHGEVSEHIVSTDAIRAIGNVGEMEVIYETSGVVASLAFHNGPGDHPIGITRGSAVLAATPHVADSATEMYRSDGYFANDWLRGYGLDSEAGDPQDVESMVDQLDSHFAGAKPLGVDIETWRGISDADTIIGPEGQVTGRYFTDKGFISTSTSEDFAAQFHPGDVQGAIIRVVTPVGFRAINIDGSREVLLPRGTSFRVEADGRGRNGRQIDLKVTRQSGSWGTMV